ncbi:hypothetical protein SAMN05216596_10917 [Pseudomonas congelans]|jgi:hypothetical protein|uniref:Uncharacterized protein n=1 Tax=Pseudomonas congelans TaxID=200452 RepID=A0A1H0VHI6_9PSED|nr:hypothetical protein [Pseudomonas congelans]MBP1145965.1 hypothetical protein [Pseudomonas sp. PvP027]MCF5164166.1 hypothetical protein [Pseudomonas congelans]SDP77698.1 hypothetical protein SAMN05216596_10917 [Pseudomonas congelans]
MDDGFDRQLRMPNGTDLQRPDGTPVDEVRIHARTAQQIRSKKRTGATFCPLYALNGIQVTR